MSNPIFALRVALRAALIADSSLLTLLGGERLYDAAPAGEVPPYITFGEAKVEDWSALGMTGHAHTLSFDVWSREGGDQEALSIVQRLAEVVQAASLTLNGHRLILLRVSEQTVDLPTSDGLRHARVTLEAFSEVIG